jgi:hypothetical protein
MNRSTSGGYVGLLALLITCLLIAFLTWRMDLFSTNNKSVGTGGTGAFPMDTPATVQRDLNAIKAAQNVKQMTENKLKEETGAMTN